MEVTWNWRLRSRLINLGRFTVQGSTPHYHKIVSGKAVNVIVVAASPVTYTKQNSIVKN